MRSILQAMRIYEIYPHSLRDCDCRPRHDAALRKPTTHNSHAYSCERAHHAAKTMLARVNSAGAADGTPLIESIVNVTNGLTDDEVCAGLLAKGEVSIVSRCYGKITLVNHPTSREPHSLAVDLLCSTSSRGPDRFAGLRRSRRPVAWLEALTRPDNSILCSRQPPRARAQPAALSAVEGCLLCPADGNKPRGRFPRIAVTAASAAASSSSCCCCCCYREQACCCHLACSRWAASGSVRFLLCCAVRPAAIHCRQKALGRREGSRMARARIIGRSAARHITRGTRSQCPGCRCALRPSRVHPRRHPCR